LTLFPSDVIAHKQSVCQTQLESGEGVIQTIWTATTMLDTHPLE
jgi:hypothetical protein